MEKVTFEEGEILLQEGKVGNLLLVVMSGTVEIFKGDLLIDTHQGARSIYGEMSVLLQKPHTATVKAASKVTAYIVKDPESYLRSKPDVCLRIMTSLATRLNAITSELAQLHAASTDSGTRSEIDDAVKTIVNSHNDYMEIEVDANFIIEDLAEFD